MAIPGRGAHAAALLAACMVLTGLPGCQKAEPVPAPTAAKPCPQAAAWPVDGHANASPATPGCNIAANLRAMVADPADLTRGLPLGPADGRRETRAIEAYQQGKTKGFQGSGAMSPVIAMPGAGAGGTP